MNLSETFEVGYCSNNHVREIETTNDLKGMNIFV